MPPALDSFIGEGLAKSPYQEMKEKYEQLALYLRIAHDGYPQSEARWGSFEEMYEDLES